MGDSTDHKSDFEMGLSQPAGRPQTTQILCVQLPDELLPQKHFPVPSAGSLQSHRLPDKGPADEAQPSAPLDVPAVAHSAHFPLLGIVQRGQPFWIRATAGPIHLRRRALTQRFVRTLLVVMQQPATRTALHRPAIGCCGVHHLSLIATMELFVPCVVARTRPPGELDTNTQSQPPYRQARKT